MGHLFQAPAEGPSPESRDHVTRPLPPSTSPDELALRSPTLDDGHAVLRLVQQSGALEANSCYAYLLLCTHFADTCLVATRGNELVGFVAAYLPPSTPNTVFVWQIGVDPRLRGQGVAKRLLRRLVELPACSEVQFLEATVGETNAASQRLFRGFARDLEVPCEVGGGFPASAFGPLNHEDEVLHRIGPIRRNS